MDNKVAVLLTCYNRKDITKRCLDSLYALDVNVDVFVVDDGSTDGTSEMINERFSEINLIKAEGNLFWNRGMRRAWIEAAKHNYEYYLWLNDDVVLYDYAFEEIMKCSELCKNEAIISGVVESHDKEEIIYGGYDVNKNRISPNGKMKKIKFLNGNFVLITKFVYNKIGYLDSSFHHDLGDVDYGLRALKARIKVFTTRRPIGSGEINKICRVRLNNSSIIKRFKKLNSPLGANPKIIFYYRKKHFGIINALLYGIFLIGLNIIPDSVNSFLFKKKYK